MKLPRRLWSIAAAINFVSGCAAPMVESRQPAHVVILPGIGGNDPFVGRMRRMIEHEVPATSAQVWDWTRIEPGVSLFNLAEIENYPRNLRRAKRLADQLIAWRRTHANTRLYLVGYSGGTGIALFAAQLLPAGFRIERTVLISSGLSPGYDLSAALQHSRGGVYSYYSTQDTSVLRDLTRRHGTMDRIYCESAGYCGFPPPCDRALAPHLKQLEWTPQMRESGNNGGHIGALAAPFVRRYLLPLFEPNDARIPLDWRGSPAATSRASR